MAKQTLYILVFMPFKPKFDDIYKSGIKSALTELGYKCERVDEQGFTEHILDHVYKQISDADLIIADTTTSNPNVYYEIGYAHSAGKKVVFLSQKANELPFNIAHYPHIFYEGNKAKLKRELIAKIPTIIKNPSDGLASCYKKVFKDYSRQIKELKNSLVRANMVLTELPQKDMAIDSYKRKIKGLISKLKDKEYLGGALKIEQLRNKYKRRQIIGMLDYLRHLKKKYRNIKVPEHKLVSDKCVYCGCRKQSIDHFGWLVCTSLLNSIKERRLGKKQAKSMNV